MYTCVIMTIRLNKLEKTEGDMVAGWREKWPHQRGGGVGKAKGDRDEGKFEKKLRKDTQE